MILEKSGKKVKTHKQESLIGDNVYHEKKLKEEISKEKNKYKAIPIDPDHFVQILEKIGRKKL